MNTPATFPLSPARHPADAGAARRARWLLWLPLLWALAGAVLVTFSGCAVQWVSTYDAASIARTTEISKNALALYQQLLSTPPAQRAAAVNGPLKTAYGDVETQIRVHLLIEQSRSKNTESVTIATDLLGSWQKFSASQHGTDPTAMTDATLNAERDILQRHLRAAFVAEEAKKPGGAK